MKRGLAAVLLAAACLLAGMLAGAVPLTPAALWRGVVDPSAPSAEIIRNLRLPRVFLAFLVGGSLGVCGAALQALVRNPLAEPYLLGLSGGAGLGAVVAIGLKMASSWAVPIAAFGGALAAVALVYRLSQVEGRRLDPRVLLLAGVVVGAFATALMSAIIVLSDAVQLRNVFLWLLGGLSRSSWESLGIFLLYSIIPLGLLFLSARSLDLLVLGEETAHHLGSNVERTRVIIYLATALLTAAGVATCGIIGFVGLVVPHAVRRVWGPLHRTMLPFTFLVSGCFLVLADAVARTVVRPAELPVGVVTALIGVPVFALLLRRTLA
ncbi:MAG: iron ABC transporter permease [Gemmatimonadota bacterium]